MTVFKDDKNLKKAAVLVPVYEKQGELRVILTKRSDNVEHHKGQICFPGGMHEKQDEHLWHTALRETNEELGILPHQIHYVSELKKQQTLTSQFHVKPFLAFLPFAFKLTPCKNEVELVLDIPLSHFKNKKNLSFESHPNHPECPVFTFDGHKIWGLTARILYLLSFEAQP